MKHDIRDKLVEAAYSEAQKAADDMITYGTGVVFISENGICKHITLPDMKNIKLHI